MYHHWQKSKACGQIIGNITHISAHALHFPSLQILCFCCQQTQTQLIEEVFPASGLLLLLLLLMSVFLHLVLILEVLSDNLLLIVE